MYHVIPITLSRKIRQSNSETAARMHHVNQVPHFQSTHSTIRFQWQEYFLLLPKFRNLLQENCSLWAHILRNGWLFSLKSSMHTTSHEFYSQQNKNYLPTYNLTVCNQKHSKSTLSTNHQTFSCWDSCLCQH